MRGSAFLHLFFLFLIFQFKAQPPQYFFKNYSVEGGLPFIQVSCMYQDTQGYLWSGGYGGLSRFDGKRFRNYGRKNGLPDVNVNTILGDEEGRIYIGTNKGLSVLEGERFRTVPFDKARSTHAVTALCKGFHHAIYLGTDNGLYLLSKKGIKAVKKLQGYRINAIYKGDSTALYIATDKGVVEYGHHSFNLFNVQHGLASNRVNCIAAYKGLLVFGTDNGLSFFDPQSKNFTNYYIEQGLIDENITALLNQNDQYLWVGSQSGLLRFENQQFAYYNVQRSNNSNHIRSLLQDREDNIWLGTYSGLYRYRDNSFSTFDEVNGPGNSFVFQILRDRQNNLWICTQNNGVFRYDGQEFRNFKEHHGLPDNTSRAVTETAEGHLLFGCDEGLLWFRSGSFTKVTLPAAFRGPVDVIYRGSRNRYWLGGSNGVVMLEWNNGLTKSRFIPIPSKNDMLVYGFCEDSKARLYIGTYHGGLYMLQGDSLYHLNKRYGFEEDNFLTLRMLRDKLFAATLNGLFILDTETKSVQRINSEQGLNSDLLYSIELAENKQSLWIGTNQGVNRLDLKKYLEDGQIRIQSFGKEEGFAGVECNTGGIWEDKDGTIWFGTVNGLVKHQPFQFKQNNYPSRVILQNIQLANSDTALKAGAELHWDHQSITFQYRGICLTNPEKVLYRKRLLPLEKEWSEADAENSSRYLNLPPGSYTFQVTACNNEGVWNELPNEFSFTITPPYYKTWWFQLLAVILIMALVYLLALFRIYTVKRDQKREFERRVEMSRIELKALRTQMNPHFVFNSLNAIQHYIVNSKSEEAIRYLSKFARLIRMILTYSDKPTVTVGEDLETLKLYIELEKMRFEDKFDYLLDVDSSVDLDYDIMPPLLMQPYVENAILHGLNPKPEKGLLQVHLKSENNLLICTITDNGIGRQRSSEIKHGTSNREHRSMGMKITEERLKILNEIHASRLSVEVSDLRDEQGKACGTRVQLFIPLNS